MSSECYQKGTINNFVKFTGKHLCQSLFINRGCRPQACIFNKKETPTQVFSCEFFEIFDITFFCGTPPVAASGYSGNIQMTSLFYKNI